MKYKMPLFVLAIAAIAFPAWASGSLQMDGEILRLEHGWARIKYQVPGKNEQIIEMTALAKQADDVIGRYPNEAAPLIWEGTILSTEAGLKGGFGGLSLAKQARKILEKAAAIDPKALDGSALTTLGALYTQVPGFPLGFGNKNKASKYLEEALVINPNGIDSNFFYGDFLFRHHDNQKALTVLQHALQAPPRPGREDADAGRRGEVNALIQKVEQKLAMH